MDITVVVCIFGKRRKYTAGLRALLPKVLGIQGLVGQPQIVQVVVGVDTTVPRGLLTWLEHYPDNRITHVPMEDVAMTGETRALWRILLMAGRFNASPMRYVAMDVDSVDHGGCLAGLRRTLQLPPSVADTAHFLPVDREYVRSMTHGYRIASDLCDVVFDVIQPTVWQAALQELLQDQALDMTGVFRAYTGSDEPLVFLHEREKHGFGVDETVLTQYLRRLHDRGAVRVQMLPRSERSQSLRPLKRHCISDFGAYRVLR
jgi:hypothetical protein